MILIAFLNTINSKIKKNLEFVRWYATEVENKYAAIKSVFTGLMEQKEEL